MKPSILASAQRGLKVLLLDPNLERTESYESRSELDPHLQRIAIYGATSVSDAKTLIKKNGVKLAIVSDGIDGKDFVSIQLELRHTDPEIHIIALVDTPSLTQYRESKQIGGLVDIGSSNVISSYESFRDLVFGYIREHVEKPTSQADILEYASLVQRCSLVGRPEQLKVKQISQDVLIEVAAEYDLSAEENLKLMSSERIYSPDLDHAAYERILGEDKYGLLSVLKETGTWLTEGSKPTSVSGFIITASNYISSRCVASESAEDIVSTILARPKFLLHPAIRTLNGDKILQIASRNAKLAATG